MILSSITFIIISGLFTTSTLGLIGLLTILRMMRLAKMESKVVQNTSALNTTKLLSHLQAIPISVIEIDAEVATLKQEIITAAHKHHITVDKHDTQPDNPFDTPENRERLIKVVEKQQDVATRVG